jgi:imidazolonepropionase-like amidohydrolase
VGLRRWIFRFLVLILVVLVVALGAGWVLEVYPRRVAHPRLNLAKGTVAIENARIYISPTEAPIDHGTVVVTDGLVAAVGEDVHVPAGATIIPCDHCVVTAGFWNAHVHLTEQKWANAEWKPAEDLNAGLADMFLSRGFTTVVDVGSHLSNTLPIRRRIESGELNGPFIYTAGGPLYPPHGVPYYLRDTLPKWIQWLMAQPNTPEEARREVRENLRQGADVTKLFTGSWVARGRVLPMPLDIAKAAVETSHLNGRLVFAHPSDLAGTKLAIDSGVDVLAHAADDTEGVDEALLASAVKKNMAMTPTLKMFATTVTTSPKYLNPIYAEVKEFHELGGTLIFGTDVGYMTDYSTEGEYEGLSKCGLTPMDVLAMLTTNAATKLDVGDRKGTVTVGKLGDLTILGADPSDDVKNFSKVEAVVRSGKVVWRRQ